MKRILLLAISLLLISSTGCAHFFRGAQCKRREKELQTRVATLKRDAREQLPIGTHKDAVMKFFADNEVPITFAYGEAVGSVNVLGCAPFGCGSDDAVITLSVGIDKAGTVTSAPSVTGIYTNCL